jgi:hypothetical protein
VKYDVRTRGNEVDTAREGQAKDLVGKSASDPILHFLQQQKKIENK